jgi:hypothetical protein
MSNLLKPKWYWVTRSVGAFAVIYELLIDHSPERGTIILAAFGVMGFDWVARRDNFAARREKREKDE